MTSPSDKTEDLCAKCGKPENVGFQAHAFVPSTPTDKTEDITKGIDVTCSHDQRHLFDHMLRCHTMTGLWHNTASVEEGERVHDSYHGHSVDGEGGNDGHGHGPG